MTAVATALSFVLACVSSQDAAAAAVKVPGGTAVMLRTTQPISPKTFKPGDRISFSVADNVVVDGTVVIKAGSEAVGEVVQAEKRGILGKPDRISVRLTSVTAADGTLVPIAASKSAEGDDKMVLGIVLTLICLPFLLMKGGEAQIAAGTTVQGTTTGTAEVKVAMTDSPEYPVASEASSRQ
jgi:hypothetical protein